VASGERLVTRRALGGEPGEILTVVPTRVYRYARRPCLTFERFENRRIDVPALNLEPLGLSQLGVWDPDQHYWGEKGPVEEWAKQVHAGGARPEFMFEEALPFEPGLFGEGRIRDAVILRENGDLPGSIQVLHQLLECDLRVLDAHAHLGHFSFDIVRFAFTHYRIGYEIGLLSLPGDFNGVLPWACLENRPFLRCMHGFGLCLWRLERWEEAEALFTRMLWFNPTDNLGARFLLGDIRGRVAWKPEEPWT